MFVALTTIEVPGNFALTIVHEGPFVAVIRLWPGLIIEIVGVILQLKTNKSVIFLRSGGFSRQK